MSGAKELMDEIRKNHYSNVESSKNTKSKDGPSEDSAKIPPQEIPVRKKRGRKPKSENCHVGVEGMFKADTLFTVTIVGGLALPEYPLEKGEKLAIAKLTPIKVAT